jgi:2,4-dienoyl-CoA reductase-like NADH-dependent reductase (Old Yellow Enzyme family)/xanthine/CO dehydrogenase XdhC/CoxF family maturation factor
MTLREPSRALDHLFAPLTIGGMSVANRIMLPGMSAGMMLDEEGRVTPEMIAYYIERARNRPGLMAIGACAVVPPSDGGARKHPLSLHGDQFVASLTRITEAVHAYGVKFGLQVWDGGLQTGGKFQLSPSGVGIHAKAVFDAKQRPVVKVLSTAEVEEVIGFYADGARRAAEAGFDFVEIHAGHGYLISNFLTPFFNRRTDKYGGSFENRIRFLVEILRACRERVADRIPIGVKVNGSDFLQKDSWDIEETCRLAPILEQEGAAYISVTAGVMGGQRLTVPPLYEKQGCFADMAGEVRKHVTIPVATIGRIKNPVMANELIRDGVADIVCMGRAMIADPDIVGKARRGEFEDIRLCLAECRGCIDHEMRAIKGGVPGSASCVVNPRMARESFCIDIEGDKKASAQRVLVVGAGLSGLEAARRAAFSGHHVVLCERRSWIGGQIRYASMIPGRGEIADMLPWYERQLARYGAELRLNTEVDAALLDLMKPGVVIVASGSVPSVPQDMLNMVYDAGAIAIALADDLLEEGVVPGRNVLVVGGDQIGMQMADYISERGSRVTVAEPHKHFAQKMAANDRWYLIARTDEKKVRRFKGVHGIRIVGEAGVGLMMEGHEEMLPGIDAIVFASERKSVRGVAELARARGMVVRVIGDAADVISEDSGTIFANIAHAYDVARAL